MDFTKIKLSGVRVELHWVTARGGSEEKHELTSYEQAAPEFAASIGAFVPHVLRLLELPESYAEAFAVTGLSINTEESGRRGLVVTCIRKLAAANAPLVLNTPHLREEQDGDQAGKFLPPKLMELVEEAQRHATAFVNGTRAQRDMFADEKKPAPRDDRQADALDGTTVSVNGGPAFPMGDLKNPDSDGARALVHAVLGGRDRAAGRDA